MSVVINTEYNRLTGLKYNLTFAQARTTGAGIYQSNYKTYQVIVVTGDGSVICYIKDVVTGKLSIDLVANASDSTNLSTLTTRFSGYKFARSQRSSLTLRNSKFAV